LHLRRRATCSSFTTYVLQRVPRRSALVLVVVKVRRVRLRVEAPRVPRLVTRFVQASKVVEFV
jgi:hypothetical protein